MASFLLYCSLAILIHGILITLLLSATSVLGDTAICCDHHSKLVYFSNQEALKVGACGFGDLAAKLNGGNVAAASPSLYKTGMGCSACYQIRCLNPQLCSKLWTKIVVTDMTSNNNTDFVVSNNTFSSLALPHMRAELLKAGMVDIKYKRIFCEYKGHNLTVKVDKSSQYPHYLAVQFLFQGGQTQIVSVDVATVDNYNWRNLARYHGAIWEIQNPPESDLQFRFVVTQGYDRYQLWAKRTVLPRVWKRDELYDVGLQINQTDKADGCYPCRKYPPNS